MSGVDARMFSSSTRYRFLYRGQFKLSKYLTGGLWVAFNCFMMISRAWSAGEIYVEYNKLLRDGHDWIPKGFTIVALGAPIEIQRGVYRLAHEAFGAWEFEFVKSIHADVVRIQLSQPALDRRSNLYSHSYVEEIVKATYAARARGLTVILCVNSQLPSGIDESGMPSAKTLRAWEKLDSLFFERSRNCFRTFQQARVGQCDIVGSSKMEYLAFIISTNHQSR